MILCSCLDLVFPVTAFLTMTACLTALLRFLCHLEPASRSPQHPVPCGGIMAGAWHGPTLRDDTLHLGPLALVVPLLQRLDIAALIDRHLPPDPQLVYSHGRFLSLLLAARLCQPTALINVPTWAADSG